MDGNFEKTGPSGLNKSFCASADRTVTVDVDKYQEMLDGSGLSAEQKKQVLEALWSIIVMFIDLGFEVHPAQEVCGQDEYEPFETASEAFDAVSSKDTDDT
ncbi:MAG: hypothetical protein QNJ13_12530 [Paracoccaceae bacterium]|nr:hypothetical protein [Paracoccaceae bacterium]